MKKELLKVSRKILIHVKKYLSVRKKTYLSSVSFITVVITSFVYIFFITRGEIPLTSELAFTEYSVLGNQAGSIIPASCDSGTPHLEPDGITIEVCGTWTVASCGNLMVCQTNTTNSYSCTGANVTPGCLLPAPSDLTCTYLCTPWTPPPQVGISFDGAVTLPPPPSAPVVSTTYTSNKTTVAYGSTVTLTWTSTNAKLCVTSSSVSSGESTVALNGSWTTTAYMGRGNTTRTYTITCGDGGTPVSKTLSVDFIGSGLYSTCFIAGTQVTMGDATQKNIELANPGELIMTSVGPKKISQAFHTPFSGYLYAFNGDGNYFVTGAHPFMTEEGWKSFDPEATKKESPNLAVSLLKAGDTLIKEDGSTVLLSSFDKKKATTTVYNFNIEGVHDYYANGFWVHNKCNSCTQP